VAWARDQAIPEIMRLADKQELWQAFLLARKVDAVLPGDPLLAKLWPQFAAEIVWQVKPAGAEVYVRSQKDPAGGWVELGRASKKPLWTPVGCVAFKVENPGYETHTFAMSMLYGKGILPISLSPTGELPPGMVRIEPATAEAVVYLPFLDYAAGPPSAELGSYLIDTHEVTNRQFKEFVDAGGYRRRELWKHEFVEGGKAIPWEQAMAMFVDATGRPGPATWELGTYPEGKADFPVTGVSWYEAAAYAESVGKRLPTVYHWRAASSAMNSGCVVTGSNFSGSLAPVGSYRGSLNLRGLYDMAGNAREWCSNASGEERVTLGGAYVSPAYSFFDTDLRVPFDRSGTNGFRCIKLLTPASLPPELEGPIAEQSRDWGREEPFSDAVWRTWLSFVSYQKQPLNAQVELVDDSPQYWRMEKVSFDAAYGGERMVAYMLLPRNVPPPWQAVVFWPGGLATRSNSTENGQNLSDSRVWGYLVKDGRAVLYPVVKGTYERGGGRPRGGPTSMETWVMRAKDISRSLDYLESRGDIAKDRIAFLGFSFGAYGGLLPCATEPRFKVGILQSGGLRFSENLGWAHRIKIPIQMINGRYDSIFPYRTNQVPLFRALATPEDEKRHIVLETDHDLSGGQKEIIKANLEWLDTYLGPVKR
jgi:dienelactone hydrolase